MSRVKTILCLAIAMLVASAFLVVAQDRIEIAATAPDTETQIPDLPLNAAVGGVDGIGAAVREQNPYNSIDGVPTFGAFARTESR